MQTSDYVYLNTTKTLGEAGQIAKNIGMEIVVKTDSAWLEFEDLSPNERLAWYDATAAYMKGVLEEAEKNAKIMHEARMRSKNYVNAILEIMKACRENRTLSPKKALDELNAQRRHELSQWKSIRDSARFETLYDFELLLGHRVHASVLVAKKGDNVMRYLNFQDFDDPIVTITGSNAEAILASCRKQF